MGADEVRIPLSPGFTGDEVRTLAAVKRFEIGRVSLGQAAAPADQSVRSFIAVLARHRIPVTDYPAEGLERETGA
jgi:predicted HTH domain antitoxin